MIESTPCALRGCFDRSSSEWQDTSIDEKVKILKKLINEDGEDILKLSIGMMDYCNKENGKDIKPVDLVRSMSEIMDYLLKEKI